ncbi:tetratricopeptide repeat-containing sensor histidine kinase [Chryseosolibacter indicus]|uniref:histidine kinase n=1 Tax=Chryseosolibacter indicus TaxID=2782351 RepID=A0ABS5VXC5_9BACT|nr:HAMP domain-containing sensor histidine kinase [Chryseosolibacter indicus]MBT1706065.1 HAMP domain-containing histidine kinase [Chryseosolibacter indicus]
MSYQTPDSLQLLRQDSLALRIYLSKPDSAIAIINKNIDAVSSDHQYLRSFSYLVLSKAYWAKGDYNLSIDYGLKSLRLVENTSHVAVWSKALLAIGRTFIDLQNINEGRGYIEQAVTLTKKARNKQLLAEAYREKSMLLSEVQDYDSAIYYCDLGLDIFSRLKDSVNISILYSRKGKILFRKNNYLQSAIYNRKALLLDSLVDNRRSLGISYYQLAHSIMMLGRTDSAIILLKKSIPINLEMQNFSVLVKAHSLLADIYSKQERLDLASEHLRLVNTYKDSLYKFDKSRNTQELHALYELASKEHTIKFLEQENSLQQQQVKNQRLLVIILVLCILLLGILVYFLSRLRRIERDALKNLSAKNLSIEQQKEEIEAQAEFLQQLNNLKSKLFSVISHDLRGPMSTLHSLLDLLGRKKLTPEEFIVVSDKVKVNLDVTQKTLENLLHWSLSQMEGIKTDAKTIDIKNSITEVCTLLSESAKQKSVNIANTLNTSVYVKADTNQLHLILRNLIHNAIKFSKPNNNVTVSAFVDSTYCSVSVKDAGIGMSQAEIETVIDSNNHFSKVGTMQEKGTGLGLLLCKEFIKLNGGKIQIQSIVNEGTEVIFTLPLAAN